MNAEQGKLLRAYARAVVQAPTSLHLTSDRDEELFWKRHVLDAAALLETLPPDLKSDTHAIDVGSGNGVPGIPIAILKPTWHVTLLDSDNKKCGFLDVFRISNALKNVKIVCERAEKSSIGPMHELYDVAFARALSKTHKAIELTAAFLKKGGILIVPHGTSWQSEKDQAAESAKKMGLSLPEERLYAASDVQFTALLFRKVGETPLKVGH